MNDHWLEHISVWFDDSSPDDATCRHALDWALFLNLPLRAIAVTGNNAERPGHSPVSERIRSLAAACVQKGVSLETHLTIKPTQGAVDQFLRPRGFCVFADLTSSPMQRVLFNQSAGKPELCQLLCSRSHLPLRRVLILCNQADPTSTYLENAAHLCRAIEMTPIILVLAQTEREAQLKQGFAQGICGSQHLRADYDSAVYHDLQHAVGRFVSWRNCTHVIIERPNEPFWWDTLGSPLVKKLRDSSAPVSILTLPKTVALHIPQPFCRGTIKQNF